MSFLTDQDIIERFGGARPGRKLVAIEDAALPVTALRVLVSAQEEKPLPLLDEFVLRAVHVGFNEITQIANLLGLAPALLDDALVAQVGSGNIAYRPQGEAVTLTEAGKIAAVDLTSIAPIELELPACFDRSIWRIAEYREGDLITKRSAIEQGMLIMPAARTQHVENVDLRLMDLEHLTVSGKGRSRRLQLLSVLRTRAIKHLYLPIKLALYSDGVQPQPEVLVIVDGEESFSHQREVESMGGATALRMSITPEADPQNGLDIAGELGVNPETDGVEIVQIGMHAHPMHLGLALAGAERRILIVTPRMQPAVVNPRFVSDLERLLRKGVSIEIGYALGRAVDQSTLRKLSDLSTRHRKLHVVGLPSVERTLLMYDDTVVVSTFDWLAYRSDDERVYRMGEGTLVVGAAAADSVAAHYRKVFQANLQ